MIRLETKNCNTTLVEKLQKYQSYHQIKRSFMISFKYGLVLLRYSFVLTLSPLLSYSIQFYLEKLPSVLVYKNLFSPAQKGS